MQVKPLKVRKKVQVKPLKVRKKVQVKPLKVRKKVQVKQLKVLRKVLVKQLKAQRKVLIMVQKNLKVENQKKVPKVPKVVKVKGGGSVKTKAMPVGPPSIPPGPIGVASKTPSEYRGIKKALCGCRLCSQRMTGDAGIFETQKIFILEVLLCQEMKQTSVYIHKNTFF